MFIAIVGAILIVACVVLLLMRRSRQAKLFEIMSTESSTAQQLAESAKYVAERMGETGSFNKITELKGTIGCDAPLTSEMSKQPCVFYSTSITRDYEETYWETDSQTKQQVQRTRRNTEKVAGTTQSVGFWVEDPTGKVSVNPEGADVDAMQVVDRFQPGELGVGNGLVNLGDFTINIGGLTIGPSARTRVLGYRFRESVLPLGRKVYVLGEATDKTGQLAVGMPGQKGHKFLISLKSEEELIRSTGSAIRWMLASAIGSGLAGLVLIVMGLKTLW